MAWEKFIMTRRSFNPRISIRGKSQIGFNTAAIEDFKLKDYKFAVLYYDKENKRIGIKLTNDKDEEGVRKLRVKEAAGASLPARTFIEYYKLGNFSGQRFNAEWDKQEKMIVATLTENK